MPYYPPHYNYCPPNYSSGYPSSVVPYPSYNFPTYTQTYPSSSYPSYPPASNTYAVAFSKVDAPTGEDFSASSGSVHIKFLEGDNVIITGKASDNSLTIGTPDHVQLSQLTVANHHLSSTMEASHFLTTDLSATNINVSGYANFHNNISVSEKQPGESGVMQLYVGSNWIFIPQVDVAINVNDILYVTADSNNGSFAINKPYYVVTVVRDYDGSTVNPSPGGNYTRVQISATLGGSPLPYTNSYATGHSRQYLFNGLI